MTVLKSSLSDFTFSSRVRLISLVALVTIVSGTVFELTGYYWLVVFGPGQPYVTFDSRPLPSLIFGGMIGLVLSLIGTIVFTRRRILLAAPTTFTRACAIALVWGWCFLVLSFQENIVYMLYPAAIVAGFTVTLVALLAFRRNRPSRRLLVVGFLIATAIAVPFTVVGFLSQQRTTLASATVVCQTNPCGLGVADPTTSGPPWGRLAPGRAYDFYLDVVHGQVQAALFSSFDYGGNPEWSVGGTHGSSNWNGAGVYEFQWTAGTAGFYHIVFWNQPNSISSTIILRVTAL